MVYTRAMPVLPRNVPLPLETRGYVPGLDVLRGAAVAAVVIFHAFANSGYQSAHLTPAMFFVDLMSLGKLGVYLFFTLSGFLITGILLKEREKPRYYRNFYIRRALRILPAYLLMLVILKATGVVNWMFVVACLLFVANMAKLFHTTASQYGVLWTLAVEEQFYLLWPTLVNTLRRPRTLLYATLAGCALAPVLRLLLSLRHISTFLLLPTNMDALLYGALCALLLRSGGIHQENISAISRRLLLTGCIFLLPYAYLHCFPHAFSLWGWAVWDALGRLVPYCFFVAAVLLSVQQAQQPGAVPRHPAARFLAFLGYISYGLYLVHPLLFALYDRLFAGSVLGGSHTSFALLTVRFLIVSSVSLLVATLSRRYYEQLFLRRKQALAPYTAPLIETVAIAASPREPHPATTDH